ncbi:MAG TPA: phage envelope protein [Firmicutes bacterium]|nr:phage envelope protein [Bacillota bacterium]
MFTKEQIELAHRKVKSGADFSKYVKEIKEMGVKSHEVVLLDGTWIFKGANETAVKFQKGLTNVHIATQSDPKQFKQILTNHQNGETDYPTFCMQAGESGVERWFSDFEQMTVTYLDSNGDIVAVEPIPSIE